MLTKTTHIEIKVEYISQFWVDIYVRLFTFLAFSNAPLVIRPRKQNTLQQTFFAIVFSFFCFILSIHFNSHSNILSYIIYMRFNLEGRGSTGGPLHLLMNLTLKTQTLQNIIIKSFEKLIFVISYVPHNSSQSLVVAIHNYQSKKSKLVFETASNDRQIRHYHSSYETNNEKFILTPYSLDWYWSPRFVSRRK